MQQVPRHRCLYPLIAALLLASLGACRRDGRDEQSATTATTSYTSEAPVFTYDVKTSAERHIAEQAMQILRTQCSLNDAMRDLASLRVTIEDLGTGHYLAERYGWTRVVRVEPQFRDGELSESWNSRRVAGHVFDFRLGGGRQPGITADKWIGQEICGMPVVHGETQYRSVPALDFVEPARAPLAGGSATPPPALPKVTELLGAKRAQVQGLLGKPHESDDRDDKFVIDGIEMTVYYRRDRVARMLVANKQHAPTSIASVLGLGSSPIDVSGVKYELRDATMMGVPMVFINSMALPKKPFAVSKLLGKTEQQVIQAIGKPEVASTWFFRDDGFSVLITFDDKGITQHLAVSFDEGVYPSQREAGVRAWLGVPAGTNSMKVSGKCYRIRADKSSITFQRDYLCQ